MCARLTKARVDLRNINSRRQGLRSSIGRVGSNTEALKLRDVGSVGQDVREGPAKNATLFSTFPMFVPSLSW